MDSSPEPRTGDIFECVKSNRQHSAVKGKFYVYDCGSLKTHTSRNVTELLNGDEMLALPGCFVLANTCPFCGMDIVVMMTTNHDGVECAADWDAKTKNYCRTCNGDLTDGKCPQCE